MTERCLSFQVALFISVSSHVYCFFFCFVYCFVSRFLLSCSCFVLLPFFLFFFSLVFCALGICVCVFSLVSVFPVFQVVAFLFFVREHWCVVRSCVCVFCLFVCLCFSLLFLPFLFSFLLFVFFVTDILCTPVLFVICSCSCLRPLSSRPCSSFSPSTVADRGYHPRVRPGFEPRPPHASCCTVEVFEVSRRTTEGRRSFVLACSCSGSFSDILRNVLCAWPLVLVFCVCSSCSVSCPCAWLLQSQPPPSPPPPLLRTCSLGESSATARDLSGRGSMIEVLPDGDLYVTLQDKEETKQGDR